MNPTFQLVDQGWDKLLTSASAADRSALRIICPFIKLRAVRRLLTGTTPDVIQVITRFHLGDLCDGVSDTAALRVLLDEGAQVRGVKGLHAKLYLFGDQRAIVTSANLTEAALLKNHEFGFVTSEPAIISRCRDYFDALWAKSGNDLAPPTLDTWEKQIEAVRTSGARSGGTSGLTDQGEDVGITPGISVAATPVYEAPQAFVKFFGEGHNRARDDLRVLDEVKRSGCHWACSYPAKKRPRGVQDGALMFVGRLMRDPRDTIIYGRAIAMRHQPGRDEATPEDIKARSWKAQWSMYVRVHHAEFVAGTLANGVRLSELMGALKSDSFASTQRNAKKGSGNTEPRHALRQQAQVELSNQGFVWLNERLEAAFQSHGKLTPVELASLDWPAGSGTPPPACLEEFRKWLVNQDGKADGTAQGYARFLTRCAEHYGETINAQTMTSDAHADELVKRVSRVVSARGRLAEGTFNSHDVTDNLTPAIRAYVRFVQAATP
ncbi:hypothetical protein GC207_14895 [bacterium]|nr:hypothetical protein [bacterium]